MHFTATIIPISSCCWLTYIAMLMLLFLGRIWLRWDVVVGKLVKWPMMFVKWWGSCRLFSFWCFHGFGFVMTVCNLWDRTTPLQHWCNAKWWQGSILGTASPHSWLCSLPVICCFVLRMQLPMIPFLLPLTEAYVLIGSEGPKRRPERGWMGASNFFQNIWPLSQTQTPRNKHKHPDDHDPREGWMFP
jgi:hypothetical protein